MMLQVLCVLCEKLGASIMLKNVIQGTPARMRAASQSAQ